MKHILLILDGAADAPHAALGGHTPLEVAKAPALDSLAARGRLGRVRTAVPGLPVDSLVCILGLLGYDAARHAPRGRAAFEAQGRGLCLGPDDLALRCNLVSVTPDARLADSTGGMPSNAKARHMLDELNERILSKRGWELHAGQTYRNLLLIRGAGQAAFSLTCAEPHMHIGESVGGLAPQGTRPESRELAEELGRFMEQSRQRLAASGHMAWLWSPATVTNLPPFRLPGLPEESGARAGKAGGAVIAALDFMHGLARAAGLAVFAVPGATGDLATDYAAKARAAIRALDEFDFVLVHVNAADEAAHQRDPKAKVKAIEDTDAHLIRPLLAALRARYAGAFRIIVCADHATLCASGAHGDAPPPFLVYDDAKPARPLAQAEGSRFTEGLAFPCLPLPAPSFLSLLAQSGWEKGGEEG